MEVKLIASGCGIKTSKTGFFKVFLRKNMDFSFSGFWLPSFSGGHTDIVAHFAPLVQRADRIMTVRRTAPSPASSCPARTRSPARNARSASPARCRASFRPRAAQSSPASQRRAPGSPRLASVTARSKTALARCSQGSDRPGPGDGSG